MYSKVFFKDMSGTPLNEWLDDKKNKNDIRNYRIFYIVSTKSEPDVLKFGVHCGRNPYGRLNAYVIEHGKEMKTNKCTGVFLHYLAGNHYNEDVYCQRSRIWKLELYLKRYFKEKRKIYRGSERVRIKFKDLIKLVEEFQGEDEPTRIRREQRKTSITFNENDRIKALWTKKDVEENGGTTGFFAATVTRINQESIRIKFDDGFYKSILKKDFDTHIRPLRS